MKRQRILGAIAFPGILAAWSAALVMALPYAEADSVFERPCPECGSDLQIAISSRPDRLLEKPPTAAVLDDSRAWRAVMAEFARHSEVANGTWQPATPRPVPAIRPVAQVMAPPAVAPAAAPVAPAAAPAPESHPVGRPVLAAEKDLGGPPAPAAVRKTPSTALPALNRQKSQARRALLAGRFLEAYAVLRPAVAEARRDTEFLGLLAVAAMRVDRPGEAMVLYEHLAGLDPASGRWRAGLALARDSLGFEAHGDYRRALALIEGTGSLEEPLRARLSDPGPPEVS